MGTHGLAAPAKQQNLIVEWYLIGRDACIPVSDAISGGVEPEPEIRVRKDMISLATHSKLVGMARWLRCIRHLCAHS